MEKQVRKAVQWCKWSLTNNFSEVSGDKKGARISVLVIGQEVVPTKPKRLQMERLHLC